MKTRQLLLAAAGLVVAASAFAWPDEPPPPPPPPPPPVLNDCSPGFWKNHTELWVGMACTGVVCDDLLADLKFKGPGAVRHEAASLLNAWADEEYGYALCTE